MKQIGLDQPCDSEEASHVPFASPLNGVETSRPAKQKWNKLRLQPGSARLHGGSCHLFVIELVFVEVQGGCF